MILLFVIQFTWALNFHWKGNLTHESVTMKVFYESVTRLRIVYWKGEAYADYLFFSVEQVQTYPIVVQMTDLEPNSQYFYFLDTEFKHYTTLQIQAIFNEQRHYPFGDYNPKLFSFTTVGAPQQPYSFNISMSGCARTGSTSPIFKDIYQNTRPQMFFMLGDMHYSDINQDKAQLFEKAYRQVFSSPTQSYLYQQVPIEYQFDDHDFGKNDADGTSITRVVANFVYWSYVPHGDLHNYQPLFTKDQDPPPVKEIRSMYEMTENEMGTFRLRVVGRTVIIVLDLRTFKGLDGILGDQQRNWLLSVFQQIQVSSWVKALLLVSSVNFHGEDWSNFAFEQKWVAEQLSWLQERRNIQVLIISSDSHMTALHNGYNSFIQDLESRYTRGLTETMCGSLDKPGSCKTTPLTFGPWLGRNHYSNVEVIDTHERTCIVVRGFERREELFKYDSCNEFDRSIAQTKACPISLAEKLIYSFGMLVVVLIIIALASLYNRYKKIRAT